MGEFRTVGNYRDSKGSVNLDPRLLEILETAASLSEYDIEAFSGVGARKAGTTNHPKGYAVDVYLVNPETGKRLPNYQAAETFPQYERFAQIARTIQQDRFPELDNTFRWGGYFKGGPNKLDLMHFDVNPKLHGSMAGGSWEGGANSALVKAWGLTGNNPGLSDSRYSNQIRLQVANAGTAPIPYGNIPTAPVPLDIPDGIKTKRAAYAAANNPLAAGVAATGAAPTAVRVAGNATGKLGAVAALSGTAALDKGAEKPFVKPGLVAPIPATRSPSIMLQQRTNDTAIVPASVNPVTPTPKPVEQSPTDWKKFYELVNGEPVPLAAGGKQDRARPVVAPNYDSPKTEQQVADLYGGILPAPSTASTTTPQGPQGRGSAKPPTEIKSSADALTAIQSLVTVSGSAAGKAAASASASGSVKVAAPAAKPLGPIEGLRLGIEAEKRRLSGLPPLEPPLPRPDPRKVTTSAPSTATQYLIATGAIPAATAKPLVKAAASASLGAKGVGSGALSATVKKPAVTTAPGPALGTPKTAQSNALSAGVAAVKSAALKPAASPNPTNALSMGTKGAALTISPALAAGASVVSKPVIVAPKATPKIGLSGGATGSAGAKAEAGGTVAVPTMEQRRASLVALQKLIAEQTAAQERAAAASAAKAVPKATAVSSGGGYGGLPATTSTGLSPSEQYDAANSGAYRTYTASQVPAGSVMATNGYTYAQQSDGSYKKTGKA